MKHPDWPERLHAYLKAPTLDHCAAFCAGAIEAMTGDNPMPDLDPSEYQDADTVRPAVDKVLGPSVSVLEARRGDVAMMGNGALGIVTGSRVAVVCEGVKYAPLSRMVCAWRVE